MPASNVTVTATYKDVEVVQELLSITVSNFKTSFEVGDEFEFGGVVTAHYTNGKADANVTSQATFSGYDMNVVGNQTVTVSYTENAITKTTTYQITVSEKVIPPEPPFTPSSSGLSGGAIAGIVIGSVLVVGIGGFALVWFVIKKKTWADFLALFKKK